MKNNISLKITSWVIILLVIVIFASVNILSGFINNNFNLRIDLSRSNLLDFSPITKELIKKLDNDDSVKNGEVKIISIIPDKFRETSDPYDVIDSTYAIIEKFQAMTGKISFVKLDPKTDPGIYERYKKDSGDHMDDISIIVTYKEKYRIIDSSDLANLYQDDMLLLKSEQNLSTSIDYAVYGKKLNIYVSTGHGETITAPYLKESFPLLYGDIASLNLTNTSVPDNADLLIINPVDDFTPQEITAINGYMKSGGNLMVIYDKHSQEKDLSNIEEYFREWGVEFVPGYAIEGSSAHHADLPLELLPNLYNHDIIASIGTAQRRVLSCDATAIIKSSAKNITYTPLLITSEQSFVSKSPSGSGNKELNGPFSVACLTERLYNGGKKAQVVFVGGEKLFDRNYIVNSAFANADYISNCIKYTTGSSSLLDVGPKDITNRGMDISKEQSQRVMILTVIVIPAIFLIWGLVTFIRRRKL